MRLEALARWLQALGLMVNLEIKPSLGEEAKTGKVVAQRVAKWWAQSEVKPLLSSFSTEALDERDGQRWTEIISLTINLEHAGDLIERVIVDAREKKIAHNLSFSEAGMQEIAEMHARVVSNLRLGLSVFLTGDIRSAQQLMAEKANFRELERKYARSQDRGCRL